jgi:hypothetical protein
MDKAYLSHPLRALTPTMKETVFKNTFLLNDRLLKQVLLLEKGFPEPIHSDAPFPVVRKYKLALLVDPADLKRFTGS